MADFFEKFRVLAGLTNQFAGFEEELKAETPLIVAPVVVAMVGLEPEPEAKPKRRAPRADVRQAEEAEGPIAARMRALLGLPEAKGKTFDQARSEILTYLPTKGWSVKASLKIPHATSPDGDFRLWFKTQAVYFTQGKRHDYGDARTISYDLDIRKMTPEEFVAAAMKRYDKPEPADQGVLDDDIEEAKARYVTCPECEASFSLKPGEPLPPHKFLSKPCPASGDVIEEAKTTKATAKKLAATHASQFQTEISSEDITLWFDPGKDEYDAAETAAHAIAQALGGATVKKGGNKMVIRYKGVAVDNGDWNDPTSKHHY